MAQGPDAAHAASSAKSVFMGHTVSAAESPMSMLADAAEEIGFAVDKTKDYEIARRKERQSAEAGKKLLAQYRLQMQQAGKSDQINTLVESLKHLKDPKAMERRVAEAFGDPADAWAALEEAREAFEKDPAVTQVAKDALAQCSAHFGQANAQAIRLGIQGAVSAAGFPDIGGPDVGRDLYRQTVGEFSSVSEVFSEIKSKFGASFDRAMDFLFAALSADIASDDPSMEMRHLEGVHEKLGLVRLTQSGYRLCEEMMSRWQKVHGVKNSPLSAMDLLGSLMQLRGVRYLGADRIDAICSRAQPPDIEREVLFHQDLLSTIRRMPPALFDGDEGLATVVGAAQHSLDAAVEREDEYLASLE